MTEVLQSGPVPTTQVRTPQAPPAVSPPAQQPKQAEDAQEAQLPQQNQKVIQDREEEKAKVTEEAQRRIRGNKARIEFRDQDGNVVDQDMVRSLQKEGKIQLETRYEARSRLPHGHEVDVVDGLPDVAGKKPEESEKKA